MAKSSPSKPEPLDFGEFTRDRVVDILKKSGDTESPAFAIMAATLLASIDAQGPSPRDMIATALDVLARSDTAVAHDLLWQAAEHARNPASELKLFGGLVPLPRLSDLPPSEMGD